MIESAAHHLSYPSRTKRHLNSTTQTGRHGQNSPRTDSSTSTPVCTISDSRYRACFAKSPRTPKIRYLPESRRTPPPHPIPLGACLLRRLRKAVEVDAKLVQWKSFLEQQEGFPLYWTESNINANVAAGDEDDAPYTFPNFKTAHVLMYFWSLRILLRNLYHTLLGQYHKLLQTLLDSSQLPKSTTHGEAELDFDLPYLNDSLATRLEMANNILRSMSYCHTPDKGYYVASRTIFALRVALATFEQQPDLRLERCREWFDFLSSKRGMRASKEIGAFRVNRGLEQRRAELRPETSLPSHFGPI